MSDTFLSALFECDKKTSRPDGLKGQGGYAAADPLWEWVGVERWHSTLTGIFKSYYKIPVKVVASSFPAKARKEERFLIG